jgi:hypothetical protein
MKPHKHAKEIKAWADGAEVEYFDATYREWFVDGCPIWFTDVQYRIKPQPKPDVVLYTRITNCGIAHLSDRKSIDFGHNLKLTICGERGWLVSAEVIE